MAPHKLNKDKQKSIREKITDMMREAEPTPFAVEGPCRAGIRSSLCLQSWPWEIADRIAAEIVTAALNVVGAKRPTWYEGQPEWTQPGALPIEREHCQRCRRPLPEGHRKFCSHECNTAYHGAKRAERADEEIRARQKAQRAAWSEKQPPRPCECCGQPFKPKKKDQRFCGQDCVRQVYGFAA